MRQRSRKGGRTQVLCRYVTFMRCVKCNCISRPCRQSNKQELGKMEPGSLIPPGIWTLADVLSYGREKGVCPYFTIRRMVSRRTVRASCVLTINFADVLRRHHNLFFPLPSRPQSCRTSIQGYFEGRDRSLRRSPQYRYVPLTFTLDHLLTVICVGIV